MDEIFAGAEAYERQGSLDQAITEYARLSHAGLGGAEALIRAALLQRQQGKVNEPSRLLERAALAAPEDPYPHMRLGQIAEGLRRHTEAADHYAAAARVAPWSDEMRVNLAATYYRLGWLDLAYRVARTLSPTVADWWAGVRRRGLSGYRDLRRETLALLKSQRGQGDRSPEQGWDLARRLFHLGRLRMCRRVCAQLSAFDPLWFWPVWLTSDILGREAGADAAVDYLRSTPWAAHPSPEYLEAEIHQLHEAGRYVELLDRLAQHADVARTERVHDAAVVALYVLDRDQALQRYCLDWMGEAPKLATPAAFLALTQIRQQTAAGFERAKAEPRSAGLHLMQFWNSPDVPHDVRDTMASWTRRNPLWRHTVFDAARARLFLAEHLGPDAAEAFRQCYHPAMMADMFRVAFLSVHGGLYADADESCVAPLDPILPDMGAVEILAPHSGGIPGFVDNNFFGGRAGSTIMQAVVRSIVEDILLATQEGRRPDIWQVTGPGALTRGVAQYLGAHIGDSQDAVVLLPVQQYRAYVRTEENLSYKTDPASNWRLAELV